MGTHLGCCGKKRCHSPLNFCSGNTPCRSLYINHGGSPSSIILCLDTSRTWAMAPMLLGS
ncbi:unnamed protein product, partial [Choristocarpus tenellus]